MARYLGHCALVTRAVNGTSQNFTVPEKAPTRAFSLLKVPISAFTIRNTSDPGTDARSDRPYLNFSQSSQKATKSWY